MKFYKRLVATILVSILLLLLFVKVCFNGYVHNNVDKMLQQQPSLCTQVMWSVKISGKQATYYELQRGATVVENEQGWYKGYYTRIGIDYLFDKCKG